MIDSDGTNECIEDGDDNAVMIGGHNVARTNKHWTTSIIFVRCWVPNCTKGVGDPDGTIHEHGTTVRQNVCVCGYADEQYRSVRVL